MKLKLEIITQEKHLLTQEISQITAPALMGEVTILPGHIPMFTRLSDGILRIKDGKDESEFAILGGFMDVGPNNKVTILADSAFRASDINIAKAEEARQRAEEALKSKAGEVDFKQAEASLRRAMLELKVARRLRTRQTPGSES
jgi:F-type H+-transporting ATPase subunit epsilon